MKNNKKKTKKNPKKEELPSFLLGLNKPDTLLQPPKKSFPVSYLGPLFFGECVQLYPLPHPVSLRQEPVIIHTKISQKNIFDDWFLPKEVKERKQFVAKSYKLCVEAKKKLKEDHPRVCPGVLRVYKRELVGPCNLGENTSPIYGETSREIPICTIKSRALLGSNDEEDYDIFTLSDIREKRRFFMSANERAAHAHFPKEFAMVRVYGPKIPESLTVSSLPSRRKRVSETGLNELSDQKTKVQKTDQQQEEEESRLSKEEAVDVEMVKPPNVRFTPSNSVNFRMSMDITYNDEGFEEMEGVEIQSQEELMEEET